MAKERKKPEEEVIEEVLENHDLQEEGIISESFFDKNKNIIFGAGVAVLIGVALYFMYQNNSEENERVAQIELFKVQQAFAQDSLHLVINGDGLTNKGATYIASEYSSTKAGNLANYYLGVAKLKQGSFPEAIESLSKFNSDDFIVQARAYSLIGDANLESGKVDEAIKFYKKATEYKPTKEFTPNYLLKLAIAFELKGDNQGASSAYEVIVTQYPTSSAANTAKRNIAKHKG